MHHAQRSPELLYQDLIEDGQAFTLHTLRNGTDEPLSFDMRPLHEPDPFQGQRQVAMRLADKGDAAPPVTTLYLCFLQGAAGGMAGGGDAAACTPFGDVEIGGLLGALPCCCYFRLRVSSGWGGGWGCMDSSMNRALPTPLLPSSKRPSGVLTVAQPVS